MCAVSSAKGRNVVRHAAARSVLVRISRPDSLGQHGGTLQVLVQDDGMGFAEPDGPIPSSGFGLKGMGERAERIGGVLEVETETGIGTTVTLELQEAVS